MICNTANANGRCWLLVCMYVCAYVCMQWRRYWFYFISQAALLTLIHSIFIPLTMYIRTYVLKLQCCFFFCKVVIVFYCIVCECILRKTRLQQEINVSAISFTTVFDYTTAARALIVWRAIQNISTTKKSPTKLNGCWVQTERTEKARKNTDTQTTNGTNTNDKTHKSC